jgi:monoamine oxidase
MGEFQQLFAAHAEAERLGMPVEEVLGALDSRPAVTEEGPTYTRRSLLLGGAGLLAGAALAARPSRSLAGPLPPRIAIVGAGLAGLRCAHALWTSPRRIASTVYEANPARSGGRCWTLRGFFDNGLSTEHGGAFIDTNHHLILELAEKQLGLQRELVCGGALSSGEEIYWINGAYYTYEQAAADWRSVGYSAFHEAKKQAKHRVDDHGLTRCPFPSGWTAPRSPPAAASESSYSPSAVVSVNGSDPAEQSALNLIEMVGGAEKFRLVRNDEKWHIVGGNDQIVTRMLEALPSGAVQNGQVLVGVTQNIIDGTIILSFQQGLVTTDVIADYVVLALPFSTLREVDLSKSGLSKAKQTVIGEFGMGTNAKIHVQLNKKTWPPLKFDGVAYSEWESFGLAWDDSVPLGPGGAPALLLGYPARHVGKSQLIGEAHGEAPKSDVDWFLNAIEPIFPGTKAQYTGRAYEDHWALDPWVRGSYSCPRVGQANFTTIAAAPGGRIHFAGEHTSERFEGFLVGALESGERAPRSCLP